MCVCVCVFFAQAGFYLYSPRDDESIAKIIEDADVVVNMIGKRYETKHMFPTNEKGQLDFTFGSRVNFSFKEVNVDIASKIARIAAETPSVKQLVHVSALAANPDSTSEWARTKYEGEMAVKEIFPEATIIRPATLFGVEDRFLNW
jgi:NADH dehydrogenase (ubiquinone) 1 alpha subcomplex subunit 9